ncbi:hypothetical protein C8F01DRAFT_972069 [Mycena amicta]|nr:hypothetical protein C8F01DRAFT_972069 [Mycena amicta]
MDLATPTKIDEIDDSLLGKKLRVAGQVLAYDPHTGIALLRAGPGGAAVALDVGDCVSAWPAGNREWLGEHLCTVMAIGYLEGRVRCSFNLACMFHWPQVDLRLPSLPRHVSAPRVVDGIALKVLLVAPNVGLDLALWQTGVEAL